MGDDTSLGTIIGYFNKTNTYLIKWAAVDAENYDRFHNFQIISLTDSTLVSDSRFTIPRETMRDQW